ncbi:MAG: PQQ-dependent sugar dehydrogenase [Bacteroidota bacterium]
MFHLRRLLLSLSELFVQIPQSLDITNLHVRGKLSACKRRGKFLGLAIFLLFLFAFTPMLLPPSGLNQAPAVDPFLGNLLPSTTPTSSTGPLSLQVSDPYPNLSFDLPLHIAEEPTTNRMLVGELGGRIQAFNLTANNPSKTLFLDISGRTWFEGESGLLSFAFHPSYPDSNYIYVFYQYDGGFPNYSRLSRFTVPVAGGVADPASELVLIQQSDDNANHNGGMLVFGNDGYLYVGMGDEGGRDDEYDNAQLLDKRLFSGILRIDVDRNPSRSHPIRRQPQLRGGSDRSFTANYMIPNDNPWQDVNGAFLEEFYAIGLRNPARMSLDHITGEIYIGDVGQEGREEINILASGANYEWPFREGSLTGPKSRPAQHYGTDTGPAFEYGHSNGSNCVIGGIRYRGTALPNLAGQYIFGDNGSSIIWSGLPSGGSIPATQLMQTTATSSTGLVAFGEDLSHNIYFINMGPPNLGKLYTFTNVSGPPGPQPPQFLSQLGIFRNLTSLEPDSFAIPYAQNVPFWSDGALKSRFMIVPNDGNPNTPSEQIGYESEGNWTFPFGTVFVKHFDLPIDESNPGLRRKLETRLMVHGTDGRYYGLSYRWLDNQADAVLLEGSRSDTIAINTANGPREVIWYYPSRSECLTCHKDVTGSVLGLKTAQLNGDLSYPSTGRTANQIKTLAHLGFFDQTPDTANLNSLSAFPDVQNTSVPLQDRAMAYLDANCGYCHNPNTGITAQFDARNLPSNDLTSLIYGPVTNNFGLAGGHVIVPGKEEQSVLLYRMASLRNGVAMPSLSKNRVDSVGLDLLRNWINSIPTGFDSNPNTPAIGQTINFPPIPNALTTDPAISLQATASSGLSISYTVEEGPASVLGNTLTLTGTPGYVVLLASQPGNASYNPAPAVRQKFFVAPPGYISGTGLSGEYFDNIDLTSLISTRLDSQIQFYWGSYSPINTLQYGSYSVRWRGEIEPPFDGVYTFSTNSDDGIRLWVNGQLLINQWQNQSLAEFSNTITLNALQRVEIQLEYFESSAYSEVELLWSHSQIAREVIPKAFLYPENLIFPLDLLKFEAYSLGDRVAIDWTVNETPEANLFIVEKSIDGLAFMEIDQQPYQEQKLSYKSWDLSPSIGSNLYRLKQIDVDGTVSYSHIEEVYMNQLIQDLRILIYPNPLDEQGVLSLDISAQSDREMMIECIDLRGKILVQKTISQTAGNQHYTLDLHTLSKGVYFIRLKDPSRNQAVVRRLLLQ